MILTKDDFIENNDDDAMEYGWTLNLENDEARDEIIEALRLKELAKKWLNAIDPNIDTHVWIEQDKYARIILRSLLKQSELLDEGNNKG